MTLLELMLLTIADHRVEFGMSSLPLAMAGLMCWGISTDSEGPARTGLRRVGFALSITAAINVALCLWVPDEKRLTEFMRSEQP